MLRSYGRFLLSLASLLHVVTAFVAVGLTPRRVVRSHISLVPPNAIGEVSSWIATIDSDIANVPTNEFAPIFTAGLVVMFGGVFSTVLLGYLLEKNDLYAKLLIESFSQGDANDTFWNGVSEEEKQKTLRLIERMKRSREEGIDLDAEDLLEDNIAPAENTTTVEDKADVSETDGKDQSQTPAKKLDMFSDY